MTVSRRKPGDPGASDEREVQRISPNNLPASLVIANPLLASSTTVALPAMKVVPTASIQGWRTPETKRAAQLAISNIMTGPAYMPVVGVSEVIIVVFGAASMAALASMKGVDSVTGR